LFLSLPWLRRARLRSAGDGRRSFLPTSEPILFVELVELEAGIRLPVPGDAPLSIHKDESAASPPARLTARADGKADGKAPGKAISLTNGSARCRWTCLVGSCHNRGASRL
jgi:hypothetical protein